MKKIIIFILSAVASICFAAQPSIPQAVQQTKDDSLSSLPSSCSDYNECLDLGLKERAAGNIESVLIHYNDAKRDIKYNLFDNISVRFSPNVCPPIVDVYKKVNNVNYLMDVFTKKDVGQCVTYVANISGDGRDRDVITGQLEIKFCNQDELFETCDQGLVYSKINRFGKKKESREDSSDMSGKSADGSNGNFYPSVNDPFQQKQNSGLNQNYPVNSGANQQ